MNAWKYGLVSFLGCSHPTGMLVGYIVQIIQLINRIKYRNRYFANSQMRPIHVGCWSVWQVTSEKNKIKVTSISQKSDSVSGLTSHLLLSRQLCKTAFCAGAFPTNFVPIPHSYAYSWELCHHDAVVLGSGWEYVCPTGYISCLLVNLYLLLV